MDHCSFETQYASFIRYPVMFIGSLQDTAFIPRHLCDRKDDSKLVAWWIKELEKISLDYAMENENVALWLTSCPTHGVVHGSDHGGWNSNKVNGSTIVDAISEWAFEPGIGNEPNV